jgi:hypothetical protein
MVDSGTPVGANVPCWKQEATESKVALTPAAKFLWDRDYGVSSASSSFIWLSNAHLNYAPPLGSAFFLRLTLHGLRVRLESRVSPLAEQQTGLLVTVHVSPCFLTERAKLLSTQPRSGPILRQTRSEKARFFSDVADQAVLRSRLPESF